MKNLGHFNVKQSYSSRVLRVLLSALLVLALIPAAAFTSISLKANADDSSTDTENVSTEEDQTASEPDTTPGWTTNKTEKLHAQRKAEQANSTDSNSSLNSADGEAANVTNDGYNVTVNAPASSETGQLQELNEDTGVWETVEETPMEFVVCTSFSLKAQTGSDFSGLILYITTKDNETYQLRTVNGTYSTYWNINDKIYTEEQSETELTSDLTITPVCDSEIEYTVKGININPKNSGVITGNVPIFHNCTATYEADNYDKKGSLVISYNGDEVDRYTVTPFSGNSIKNVWVSTDAEGTIPVSSKITSDIYINGRFTKGDVKVTLACDPSNGGTLKFSETELTTKAFEIGSEYSINNNTITITDLDGKTTTASALANTEDGYSFSKFTNRSGSEVTGSGKITSDTTFIANFEQSYSATVKFDADTTVAGTATLEGKGWTVSTVSGQTILKKSFAKGASISVAVAEINNDDELSVTKTDLIWQGVKYNGAETTFTDDVEFSNIFTFTISAATSDAYTCGFSNASVTTYNFTDLSYEKGDSDNVIKFTGGKRYDSGSIVPVGEFTLTANSKDGATFVAWKDMSLSSKKAITLNTTFTPVVSVKVTMVTDPNEAGSIVLAGTTHKVLSTYNVEFGDTVTNVDNVVTFSHFTGEGTTKEELSVTGSASDGYIFSSMTVSKTTFALSGNTIQANFTKDSYTITIKTANKTLGNVQKNDEEATGSFTLTDIKYGTPYLIKDGKLTIGESAAAVVCNNVPSTNTDTTHFLFDKWTANDVTISGSGKITGETTFGANFKRQYVVTVNYGEGEPADSTAFASLGWAYDSAKKAATQWFDENSNLKTDIFENEEVWTDDCEAVLEGYDAAFDVEPSGLLTSAKTYAYVYTQAALDMSTEVVSDPVITGHEGGSVTVAKPTSVNDDATYPVNYWDKVTVTNNNLVIKSSDETAAVKYTLTATANTNWEFSGWTAYDPDDPSTDILPTVKNTGITSDIVFVANFTQQTATLTLGNTYLANGKLVDETGAEVTDYSVTVPLGYKWATSNTDSTYYKHDNKLTIYKNYETSEVFHSYTITGNTNYYALLATEDAQIVEVKLADAKEVTGNFKIIPTVYSNEAIVSVTGSVYDSSIAEVKYLDSLKATLSSLPNMAKPVKFERTTETGGIEQLKLTTDFGNTYYIQARKKSSYTGSASFVGWAYKLADGSYKWLSDDFGDSGIIDKNVEFKAVFAETMTLNFKTYKGQETLGNVTPATAVNFANVETTKVSSITTSADKKSSTMVIVNDSTGQYQTVTATPTTNNYFDKWCYSDGSAINVGDTISVSTTLYGSFTKGYAARMNASENGGSFGALPSGWSKTTIDGTTYAEKYYNTDTLISTITGEWDDYTPVKTGYTFDSWTQNPSGTALKEDTTFTATYTANKVPVTVYMNGGAVSASSMGNWTLDSSGTSYTNKVDFTYDQATSEVTADFVKIAESITRDGFTFTGKFSTDNTTGKLGLSNNNFVCLYNFAISFGKNIEEGGTVTPSTAISGIAEETPVTATVKSDEPTKLILTYSDGKTEATTITATPASGYDFAGWTIGGTTITTSTTIGSNSTIVANFVLYEYTIDATANKYTNYDYEAVDAGMVTVTPTGTTATYSSAIAENATTHVITITAPSTYSTKSAITITPKALTNYKFTGWTVKDASGAKVASMPATYDQAYSFEANYDVDTVAFAVSPYKIGTITVGCDEYHGSDDVYVQTLPTTGGTINIQKNSVVTMSKVAEEEIPTAIVITEPSRNIHTLKLTCSSSVKHTLLWMHNEDSTNKVLQAGYSTTITADSTFIESGYFNNEVCSVGYAPQSSSLGTVALTDTTSPATELNFVYTGAVATVSAYQAKAANTITVSRTSAPTGTITITATPNSGNYAFLGWKVVNPDGTKEWIEYGTDLGATTYTINDNVTFEAEFAQTCTVTAAVSDATKGSIDPTSITIPVGSQYAVDSADSNIVTIANNEGGLGYSKTIAVSPVTGNYVASWTENDTSTTTGGTINSATKLTANLETSLYNVKFVSSNVDYGEVITIPTDNPQKMLYGATLTFDGSGLTKAFQVKDGKTTFTGTANPYGNDQYTCKFDHWTIKYADGTTERVEADANFPATDTPAAHQAVYGDVEIEAFFIASYTKYDISADIDTGEYEEPVGEESTLTFVPSTLSQLNYGTLFWSEGNTIYFMEREAEEPQTITINHGKHSTFTGWKMFYYDEAYDEDMVDGQVYKLEDSMKFTANIVQGTIVHGYVQEAFTGYVIPDATVTFTYDDEEPTNAITGLFASIAHADGDKVVTLTDENGYYEFSDPCLIVGKSGTLTVERQGYDTVTQHINSIQAGDVDLSVKTDAYSGTMDLFSESRGHDHFILSYNGTIGSKTIEESEIYRTYPAAQNKEVEGKDNGTVFTVSKDIIKTSYTTTTDAHSVEANTTGANATPETYVEESTIVPVAKEGWEFAGFSLNGHTIGEGESFEIQRDKVYNIKAEYVSTDDGSGLGKTGDSLPWVVVAAFAVLVAGGFTLAITRRRRGMSTASSRHSSHVRH